MGWKVTGTGSYRRYGELVIPVSANYYPGFGIRDAYRDNCYPGDGAPFDCYHYLPHRMDTGFEPSSQRFLKLHLYLDLPPWDGKSVVVVTRTITTPQPAC